MRLTDRSRIISHQTCPRQRFYAYEINGTGLQRKSKSLPLQFGSAFHEGSEVLLSMANIEEAVGRAQGFLINQFAAHQVGFDGELPDDAQRAMEYGKEEQMALAEALLRAWWSYEGQSFLENFEVIEVEKEGRATLFERRGAPQLGNPDESLVLMFRPDALVREKMSGDLYIISWKTRAMHNKRSYDQDRHDMQSMSEVWGVEQRHYDIHCQDDLPPEVPERIKIEGVLYKYATKGKRIKDDYDGLYKQDSHLIYGWKKLGAKSTTLEGEDWAWAYKWTDDEINPKTGRPVGHTLGKGWQKVPIWREYPGGVKQWIEDLSARRVFPRHVDPFVAVFPQALPVERRADEVESWKRQIVEQEMIITNRLKLMNDDFAEPELLDRMFPQHTASCHSFSGCPFIPVCWEGAKAEAGELYQIRTANHPEAKGGDDE